MDRNLPRVYANPINKTLNNNEEVFYSTNRSYSVLPKEDIPRKINEIFASPNHVYKSKVIITTKDKEFEAVIVGKKDERLLTINGENINIRDILNIEKY